MQSCATIWVMVLAILLTMLTLQAVSPAVPPATGMPAGPGVYCRRADSAWVKIEPAAVLDLKAKGIDGFLQTDGYNNLSMTITFRGPHAPLQIPALRPSFFVRGVGPATEALIARLSGEKDKRVLRTLSSDATVGNKMGVRKKEVMSTTASAYADHSFLVTLDEDLKPGEYILLFGNGNPSFDFGVIAAKK